MSKQHSRPRFNEPGGDSATVIRSACSARFPMQNPVKERIAKLREEIAQISEANRLYLHGRKRNMPGAVGEHERRLQRLQEILDELMALTDWKKP